MKVFYPDYFDAFQCIAAACPDSCCKEWAVDVDPEMADFYRNLPGALGDRLRSVLTEDNTMTLENAYGEQQPTYEIDDLRIDVYEYVPSTAQWRDQIILYKRGINKANI